MIKTNYHTHTYRCKHAVGKDEDYVINAIKSGYKILGFSEHTPLMADKDQHNRSRMTIEELPDYLDSVLALKEKYKDDIEILVGLECEYFSDYEDYFKELKDKYHLDYLILGNHYYQEVGHDGYYGGITKEKEYLLDAYLENSYKALKSGLYSMFAHPDIICRSADLVIDDKVIAVFEKICEYSLEFDIPLEYNLSGLKHGVGYPNDAFFKVVAQKGCKVIMNGDCHDPYDLVSDLYDVGLKKLTELGCNVVDIVTLK
ncbi:MAG: histidinol-phosphatase [Erysipelotrichaceae bacterium]